MYSTVGGYLNSEGYCIDCLRKEMGDELTTDEIDFLISGPHHYGGYMDHWPVRVKVGQLIWEHVYDDGERGEIITERDVKVKSDDWIYTWRDDNGFFLMSDGEESIEGEYCGKCGEVWLGPYTAECHQKEDGCEENVATGERAIALEKKYEYKEMICATCYAAVMNALAEEVEARIKAEVDTSRSDAAYWQVDIFLRALNTMYHHDIIAHYGKVLTVADEAENTALAQCYAIFEEELGYSDLLPEFTEKRVDKETGKEFTATYTLPEKLPVFLFALQEEGEAIYETDPSKQIAPVPGMTRLGLESAKVTAIQLQLAGLE
jgi:hypothetical protein